MVNDTGKVVNIHMIKNKLGKIFVVQQSKIKNQLENLDIPLLLMSHIWNIQTIPLALVKLFLLKVCCRVLSWMPEDPSWS